MHRLHIHMHGCVPQNQSYMFSSLICRKHIIADTLSENPLITDERTGISCVLVYMQSIFEFTIKGLKLVLTRLVEQRR